jgi:hypothetical protein
VHSDVICFIAVNFVLWFIFTRMNGVALELNLRCHDPNDPSADEASFRIPTHVVADLKAFPIQYLY